MRFAPSPTGSLHLGNARTALFNWLIARSRGGTFVLRLEDTDVEREQDGSAERIQDDLRWLGLDWDEGPGTDGPYGPYRQSERTRAYRDAARLLVEKGAALRCFCDSSADDAPRDPLRHGPGSTAGHRDPCRAMSADEASRRAAAGEGHAVRFKVPAIDPHDGLSVRFLDRLRGEVAVPIGQLPDAVLLRGDGRPTYNFAVVVDDSAMKIDLVLRGDDHLSNTPIQVLLYRALGARAPEFAHVPMVLGPDHERLSKRHGATSVAAWRERGVPPEALVNALALLGWAPSGDRTIVSIEELTREFDLDRVGRSAAVFDPAKLTWISAQHIHAMDPRRLAEEVAQILRRHGKLVGVDAGAAGPWIASLSEFLRPSLERFDQVDEQIEPIFHRGGPADDNEAAVLREPGSADVLRALSGAVAHREPADEASWRHLRDQVQAETGARGKALFQPIRVALTGRAHGRELDRLVPLIVEGHRVAPDQVPRLGARIEAALAGLR